MAFEVQNYRQTVAVSITSGATAISAAVDLRGYRVTSIDMSTGWTNAVLTFTGGNSSGGTFQDLYDVNGNELTVQSTASHNICLDSATALALEAHQWLQVRSGTAAAVVAQSTTRSLNLVVIPA